MVNATIVDCTASVRGLSVTLTSLVAWGAGEVNTCELRLQRETWESVAALLSGHF